MPRAVSSHRQRNSRQRWPFANGWTKQSTATEQYGGRPFATSRHYRHYFGPSMRLNGRTINRCLARPTILLTLIGIGIGFAVAMCYQSLSCLPPLAATNHDRQPCPSSNSKHRKLRSIYDHSPRAPIKTRSNNWPIMGSSHRQLVLVGVMTAQKYIDTRAYNVWRSWAANFPGQVIFFVCENGQSMHSDMPVVALKGVDDSYPPQKKAFAMLRWMADHGGDQFDWFVRADDDVYIKPERLETLLRSLDPEKALYIGQTGLGNTQEFGRLSLADDDNFCMGGPGIVLSRQTLLAVRPHLGECLRNMYTTHEDVEVGRCIKKHVGISCTWNYEMQSAFYNNQSGRAAFTGKLNVDEVHKAITLHPIKTPVVMRRLHAFLMGQKTVDLKYRYVQLSRDSALVNSKLRSLGRLNYARQDETVGKQPSLQKFVPKAHNELRNWRYISSSANIIFCSNLLNCPRHNTEPYLKAALNDAIRQLFELWNGMARQRGRIMQFQRIEYAYVRLDPVHGPEYVVDMLLWFKRIRNSRGPAQTVRRHAYLQQPFGPLEAINDRKWRQFEQQKLDSFKAYDQQTISADDRHKITVSSVLATPEVDWASSSHQQIHIIVPLSGRLDTFKRFVEHYRMTCVEQFTGGPVKLIVVMFNSESAQEDSAIRLVITQLMIQVNNVTLIDMQDKPFSRGVALARGASNVPTDGLMFFTDVDMVFSPDALRRIRRNTVLGRQIYFPIVFSEYSPETWAASDHLYQDPFHYGRQRGNFRHFGFGLVSMYKADLDRVGGLDTNIQGWGLEDVDLFEKCIKHSQLTVFRAPDPGLVHIYHPVHCSTTMPAAQYRMCIGSRAASYSSIDALADKIFN